MSQPAQTPKLDNLQRLQFLYDISRQAPVPAPQHDAAREVALSLAAELQDLKRLREEAVAKVEAEKPVVPFVDPAAAGPSVATPAKE